MAKVPYVEARVSLPIRLQDPPDLRNRRSPRRRSPFRVSFGGSRRWANDHRPDTRPKDPVLPAPAPAPDPAGHLLIQDVAVLPVGLDQGWSPVRWVDLAFTVKAAARGRPKPHLPMR